MENINIVARTAGVIMLSAILFTSCFKDKITQTYQLKTPIYQVLSTLRKQIKSRAATRNPFMAAPYQLTHPQGLAIGGNTLIVWDGNGGQKVYNAANVSNLKLIKQLDDANVFQNGLAIALAFNSVYQYDYSKLGGIHLISKL